MQKEIESILGDLPEDRSEYHDLLLEAFKVIAEKLDEHTSWLMQAEDRWGRDVLMLRGLIKTLEDTIRGESSDEMV